MSRKNVMKCKKRCKLSSRPVKRKVGDAMRVMLQRHYKKRTMHKTDCKVTSELKNLNVE